MVQSKVNSKRILGIHILLALLSPLISLFLLLKSGNSRIIVPAGTILMMFLGSAYIYNAGSDGASHLETIERYYVNMEIWEFISVFFELISLNNTNAPSGISDPYLHFLGFLSGSVFGTPELLHVFAAFFYGIIYFSIIRILFQRIDWPKGISLIATLFLIFLTYRGITGLNSIRWWTAMWLLVYGLLAYWNYGKRKFLLLALLSIYIHFSFIAFVIPSFAAIWLFKKPKVIFVIWIVSFFLGASYQLIEPYVPALNVIEQKERYTLNEEEMEKTKALRADAPKKSKRFYASLGETSFRDYSIPFMIVFLFWIRNKMGGNKSAISDQMFAAGVLLYSFGNVMEFSPSLHGRAKAGAAVLILIAGLLSLSELYANNIKLYKSFQARLVMSVFCLSTIPVVLFHLSYALNMLSAFTIVFPAASWFLGGNDFSIRDLLVVVF